MPIAPGTGQAREDHAAARRPADLAQGVPAAPPVIRRYQDVSAVRIQDWLAGTPELKFRRGASVLLSEATGRDAWPDERLPPGVQWNTEAGDLDGVVSLIAASTRGPRGPARLTSWRRPGRPSVTGA